MKMIEQLKETSKGNAYNVYYRISDDPKEYEKITGKKIIEEIIKIYSNPGTIIELCSEKELKFLERILNNEDDIYDDKYVWEHVELMAKMIIYDNGETVSIYDEIKDYVKETLKIVNWKKVKESDKLNEVILGYLRVNGNSTMQALVAMMSFLLDMPQNKIENWIENNRFIKCYTYYTDEYFESIGMTLDIINYLNYMDVMDELNIQRSKQAIGGAAPLEPKEYKEIFYTGFSTKKASVKKLVNKLDEIGAYKYIFNKVILTFALLNTDRSDLKDMLNKFSFLDEKYMQDLLSLLDAAMDDMPSGALNGLTPKEHKAQKAKEIVTNYKHNEEYIKQENAHLSKKDVELFYKLYFGILEFTNRKYHVVPGLKIYDAKKLDPRILVDVIDEFWNKKDSILMEFAFANPFKFNDEEMKIVRYFRKGIRDLFIIVKYEEEYTTFLSKNNLYMVKGITCNIDEIIPNEELPVPAITTVLPFKDQIVFDSVLTAQAIKIGVNMRENIIEETSNSKKIYKL